MLLVYSQEGTGISVFLWLENASQGIYSISSYINDIRQAEKIRYMAESRIDAIQWAQIIFFEMLERKVQ